MRQIKFRAWDAENKELVPVVEILFDQYGGVDVRTSRRMGINEFALGPICLEQFTGLLDKNGKEIYEGDLLRLDSWAPPCMIVKFIEGAFCLANMKREYVSDIHYIQHAGINQSEVIGNIHENPELVNSGETTKEA